MDDIYKNIEEYNQNKKRKILIVIDDMIADMLSNEKLNPIVTELWKFRTNKNFKKLKEEEILSSNQRQITEQAKFTYSPLGKVLEKQTRIIVEQGREQNEATEVHGKQLLKSSSEKESLLLLKQKEIFSEFSNERINTIQDLIKQIDFNNLAYYFKGESGPKIFVDY